MITLCIGVFLIMMPFTMHASWRMWLLPAAVLVLTAWVWWEYTYERRGHIPMVNLKPVSYTHLTLPTNREV